VEYASSSAPKWGLRLSLLFHEFPDGRVGIGLLLLRATIGVLIVLQAATEFTSAPGLTPGSWIAALSEVAIGAALVAGFLTPVAAGLLGLIAIGWWTSLVPVPQPFLFPSKLLVGFFATLAGVVVLLGPGAFSIDARLFGMREIIIPPPRSNEETST